MLAFHTASAQDSPQSYVGSAVCKTCHPAVWLTFPRNPHFKSIALGKAPPEQTGCEGCHGPGGKHVQAQGGKATIVAFSELSPKQTLDACLKCHAADLGKSNIRRSSHTLANVACTSCHSIHSSKTEKFLLARVQHEVCYTCHSQIRAQFSMPFKHHVDEGFMECSDCHNPHGAFSPTWRMGQRPRMVEQVLPNDEACIRCHRDKRGPFVFEHASVRVDGCETCHQPHGSMNTRLLRRPAVFTLCLECHNGFGNFGRHGIGEIQTASTHNLADPKFHNCTVCHVRIHGSNSNPFFLR